MKIKTVFSEKIFSNKNSVKIIIKIGAKKLTKRKYPNTLSQFPLTKLKLYFKASIFFLDLNKTIGKTKLQYIQNIIPGIINNMSKPIKNITPKINVVIKFKTLSLDFLLIVF